MAQQSFEILAASRRKEGFGPPDEGLLELFAEFNVDLNMDKDDPYDPITNTMELVVDNLADAHALGDRLKAKGYTVTVDGAAY